VASAYGRLFRKARGMFDHPDLMWMSRGRRTARTRMLLEQVFWGGAWLAKYEPDDYPRVRDRMVDILLNRHRARGQLVGAGADLHERARRGPGTGARDLPLAATRLINRRGYRGASVDKISAELNVTKGSFYHHNEAKDDLVVPASSAASR
jgi:hypothetical protein